MKKLMPVALPPGWALEWNDAEIRERLHRAFVRSNPINDYTLPFLSLAKGRKVARLLEQNFGNIRIGDLWRPFFCVSANLTSGILAVHRDGPLVPALRASVAIPGLLPPVAMAGEAHVDGGMMNYLLRRATSQTVAPGAKASARHRGECSQGWAPWQGR
jgi:NTE family protein